MPLPSTPVDGSRSKPVPEVLFALAPLHLRSRRTIRYLGDGMSVALDELVERDQNLLRNLYTRLTALLYAIADTSRDDAAKWEDINLWTRQHRLDEIVDDVRELGLASHAARPSDELAKAIHDLRGGALSALLGRLQLLEYLPHKEDELNTLFILARDHLKVMRNALTGLDDTRRDADRQPKCHDMRLMLEKWQAAVIGPNWRERPVRLAMDCRYEGALTECCLESAAMDRIFYNITSNACRHAVGDCIEMMVFPIPEPPGECLRFVLSNQVSDTDARRLRSVIANQGADSADKGTGLSLLALFEPGVSSTGSGFGLTVVADFVAHAFGLESRADALRARYLGAILDGLTFRLWFHWPMASDKLPHKLDDYRHPQESLSEA